jgi:hypothetical protein
VRESAGTWEFVWVNSGAFGWDLFIVLLVWDKNIHCMFVKLKVKLYLLLI